jgi:hypothetical protein
MDLGDAISAIERLGLAGWQEHRLLVGCSLPSAPDRSATDRPPRPNRTVGVGRSGGREDAADNRQQAPRPPPPGSFVPSLPAVGRVMSVRFPPAADGARRSGAGEAGGSGRWGRQSEGMLSSKVQPIGSGGEPVFGPQAGDIRQGCSPLAPAFVGRRGKVGNMDAGDRSAAIGRLGLGFRPGQGLLVGYSLPLLRISDSPGRS